MCDCNGKGYTMDTNGFYHCCDGKEEEVETGTCKECEGEGRILHHDPINRDEFYLMCDECNGLGTVFVE